MPWPPVASRWSLQNKGPFLLSTDIDRSSREVFPARNLGIISLGCNMVLLHVQRCPDKAVLTRFSRLHLVFFASIMGWWSQILHAWNWFHWGWWIQQNRDPDEHVDELNYSDLNVGEVCHNSGRSISHTMLVIYVHSIPHPHIFSLYSPLLQLNHRTSSTAQGGGGSFKNRKPIGEIGCCE